MAEERTITAVNLGQRLVIDNLGNIGKITHWFERGGEECEPDDAITCVAECDGWFYAIDLDGFETTKSN
jgi:hypothetical protein